MYESLKSFQAPLVDNRRWWNEETEEAILLEREGLSKAQSYLPAKREEEGAIFLTKEVLTEKLGLDPERRGFTKDQVRVAGKKVRGYWVKEVS